MTLMGEDDIIWDFFSSEDWVQMKCIMWCGLCRIVKICINYIERFKKKYIIIMRTQLQIRKIMAWKLIKTCVNTHSSCTVHDHIYYIVIDAK